MSLLTIVAFPFVFSWLIVSGGNCESVNHYLLFDAMFFSFLFGRFVEYVYSLIVPCYPTYCV